MIRVAVSDYSAESRSRIIERLDYFLSEAGSDVCLLPRLNFKPLSPQELRFNSAPDVCILGPEVIARDITEIAKVKKLFPNSAVLAWLSDKQSNLSLIEQLARQGVDDVLTNDATPQYFFRRLLMLSKKAIHQNSGKLLLIDAGKGGVGITTIVAALGELACAYGKKTALIDLDFETQDLSRFLQARPFINENLRLLLDEERPITEETVFQCLNSIWQDEAGLRCMSPVGEGDDLYDPRSRISKMLLSVVEILDSTHDLLIVDMACVRSSLQNMFYRVADKLLFVINDDPASLYASVDKLTKARGSLSAGAQLCVVQNSVNPGGLGNKLLRREFLRIAKLESDNWAPEAISFCKIGQRWPGSGATFLSQAKAQSARQIEKLGSELGILEIQEKPGFLKDFLSGFSQKDSVRQSPAKLLGFDNQGSVNSAAESFSLIDAVKETVQPDVEPAFNINSLVSKPRYKNMLAGAS